MNMHRSIPLALAGAIAVALSGAASVAAAQTPPPPPAPPQPPSATMPAQPPPPPAAPMPAQPPQAPPPPPNAEMPAQPPAQPQAPLPPSATEQDQPSPQDASARFYPGTKSSATYPIQNGTLTVNAGMPAQVHHYGPPPPFKTLDSNHDGRIEESEAQAYPPLDDDFLYASGGAKTISRAQYSRWMKAQH